jgi:hypothetical protein
VVVIEARLHLRRLATGELGHRRRAGATSTPRLMSLRRKRKSSRRTPAASSLVAVVAKEAFINATAKI